MGIFRVFTKVRMLFLVGALWVQAGSGALASEVTAPPLAGQPADFSQVVGSYTLEVTAVPNEVEVGEAVRLTVRIRGKGPVSYQPRRQYLRLFPASVTRDFYLRALPEQDRSQPAKQVWEFVYELRPKHAQVQKIPALHLIYYDPVYRCYQTSYSRALPLRIRVPASGQPAASLVVPLPEVPALYELAVGPSVLRRENHLASRFSVHWLLGWSLLLLGIVLPPLFAIVLARQSPSPSVRIASKRRLSPAARQLLTALKAQPEVEQLAPLLAEYLHRRWRLPAGNFTPRETAHWLRRCGASMAQARQAAQLIQVCTVARFAPIPPKDIANIVDMINKFIKNIEIES